MSFLKEFREFAVKGNALDMAVGVILGAAFGKVVNAIVGDLIMPPLGLMIGGVDFTRLEWILRPAHPGADGAVLPAVAIRYGSFVNTVVEFLIVALSVFVVVKVMSRVVRGRETPPA